MAVSPQQRHQIRRVPVPVRHPAPAPPPISSTASQPVIPQIGSSTNLPLARAPVVVQVQQQPRGPIPLVATNSHEPLPAHASHSHHHSPHQHQYSLNTAGMDSESPTHHTTTLSAQMEEDIKAAVLASMPSDSHPTRTRRRRMVVYKKILRWFSLSLSFITIVGESVVSAVFGFRGDAVFGYAWGPLLGLWNAWRLFRLRQKLDVETISGWHFGGEAVFLAVTIALAVQLIISTVSLSDFDDYDYYEYYDHSFWRGVGLSIIFILWFIMHSILLIMAIFEKWTKPKYEHERLVTDVQPQQPLQIVIQYAPTCSTCHGYAEPQRGEDGNVYLARKGDLQPQGVAPAYLVQPMESNKTEQTYE
ncbi:hypothetical protein F5Y19DRAFT_227038 [Xylariaceae sp. FL1651]|nr:hypothetical protein F5Y19DRAFT_227038 [Xylariaceae sp. FL1651]